MDSRIIDFDLPTEWWDDLDAFFKQDYDFKLDKLRDLMKQNMGQSTFSDIRLREALFYIDTAVRINETGINREIEQRAKEMMINKKAS